MRTSSTSTIRDSPSEYQSIDWLNSLGRATFDGVADSPKRSSSLISPFRSIAKTLDSISRTAAIPFVI